jgi:hypothetical protein
VAEVVGEGHRQSEGGTGEEEVTDIFTQIAVNDVRANLRCGLMQQLLKFGEINIKGAMLDRDYTRGFAALVELRRIYVALDTVYPEDFFAAEIKSIDEGLDFIVERCRGDVLRWYVRSTDPAEVQDLGETVEKCIAHDRGWDWESEFDQALAERAS